VLGPASRFRRQWTVGVALTLLALAGCGGGPKAVSPSPKASPSSSASASPHGAPSLSPTAPARIPAPSYYLSLGDSLAFGYTQAQYDAETSAHTYSAASFDHGFTDLLAADLRRSAPALAVTNLGCPGETTTSYLDGGCPTAGSQLHDPHPGSQAAAALAFLHRHPGPGLITLALGSNDVINLLQRCPSASVSCVLQAFEAELPVLRAHLSGIVTALHAAAPRATIVTLALYNPLAIKIPGSDLLAEQANDAIAAIAAAVPDVRDVNPFPVFNPATGENATVCRLTLICATPIDIHPTPAGYAELARLIEVGIGR
jgi:lysophospholipase L1-like esterase